MVMRKLRLCLGSFSDGCILLFSLMYKYHVLESNDACLVFVCIYIVLSKKDSPNSVDVLVLSPEAANIYQYFSFLNEVISVLNLTVD
jgi:hypothetical protein